MRKTRAKEAAAAVGSSLNDNTPLGIRHRSRPVLKVVEEHSEGVKPEPEPEASAPEPYAVGYKRPPKHTQFQKGKSGNPKGRPKGAKSTQTIATELLNQLMAVRINGVQKKQPTREILLQQQLKKALGGDQKALVLLLGLAKEPEDHGAGGGDAGTLAPLPPELDATDSAMLAHYFGEMFETQGLNDQQVSELLEKMGVAGKAESIGDAP
jgi:hypothetical protein